MFEALVALVAVVVILVGLYAFAVGCVLWDAWWLYPAWGWFAEPLGLRHISFWYFIGVLLLIRGLGRDQMPTKGPDWTRSQWGTYLGGALVGPILVYLFLRVLHAVA
jgi:hypothetical protein